MSEETDFLAERHRMVREQIEARGVDDPRVLEAMQTVPRHLFVPPDHLAMAYADGPLPIGHWQTISQPYIVALMTSLLDLRGSEKVLEIGTGSGYQAAVLSYLATEIHSVERIPELARQAADLLKALDRDQVIIHVGDGSLGLSAYSPYDGILVTAAAPHVPRALLQQLAEKGRLVLPVGPRGAQYLERWIRHGAHFQREEILPVAFVPLIGQNGWTA